MDQSKIESWIETTLNIGSGFFVSVLMWAYVVKPMIDVGWLELTSTFKITGLFTVSSVARSYFWRRFFNAGLHRTVHEYVRRYVK